MNTVPAPTLVLHEEWSDADFDLPEGVPLHSVQEKEIDSDEDWDVEMDFGKSGGAKAPAVALRSASSNRPISHMTIRPPISLPDLEDEENDEGVSTIKVAALSKPITKDSQKPTDDDIEDDFALPGDLTQLSLAPLSLSHRASKVSLEWSDKDHTSSSQSSDAYSSLGFADASPSSNSASSVSLAGTETEEEEEDGELDGLVIPSGLFDSGGRQLTKILEKKKKAQITENQTNVAIPDPEDDFEMGLVIGDDVDLSPSRLLSTTQQQQLSQRTFNLSSSIPPQRPSSSLRPPSSLQTERAKSPANPPSSTRQLQKLGLSPTPPPPKPSRAQTFQPPPSTPSTSSSLTFLSTKPGNLRGQKSHSGLKPTTPSSTTRRLTRKASLSSLIEASQSQASGSATCSAGGTKLARYEAATAASRAKSYKNSTSRIHVQELKVPPTRPSTPSSNPAALRLTMPTMSRVKSRLPLSSVFVSPSTPSAQPPHPRASPPLRSRSASNTSTKATRVPCNSQPIAPKVLRRPRRPRTYGDGTELDGIDDLPTDREQEGRYRVQPKGFGNRIPGGSYPSKSVELGTTRKNGKWEESNYKTETPTSNMVKRPSRIDFPSKTSWDTRATKKNKGVSAPAAAAHTKRKPTLIRNLGGPGAPRVVGDMKWNPFTLRWEGNDHVLREFDAAVGTSTRPALITHLTGSSLGSPVGSFASGARIVGNMIFDAARMCWISTLPPDEDEPDVFANLADDEEDGDSWESRGGTIRASLQQPSNTSTYATVGSNSSASSGRSMEAASPARSLTCTISESGSDRGSRASMVYNVDEAFLASCKMAEERHRVEMKGWKSALSRQDVFAEPDRSYLYDIRALATRQY